MKRKSEWNINKIEQARRVVGDLLDNIYKNEGEKARLVAIMRGIHENEGSYSSESLLYLFLFIVSALSHQTRFGGLASSQITKLINLAYSILQLQGIQPETSSLGFLYGELHLVVSQIDRISSHHWDAAWGQQLSFQLSRKNPSGGESFQAISKGIYALRMGHALRAVHEFEKADVRDNSIENFEKARIGRIRAYRLSGQYEASLSLISVTKKDSKAGKGVLEKLDWEEYCLEASKSGDLTNMMASVQRKGSHYKAKYIVEAFFWAHAVSKREWIKRLPKMTTIARKKELGANDLGFFFKAALQLEKCYDAQIPFVMRVKSVGQLLGHVDQFASIDMSLLFYLAVARWLARNRSPDLAAIALWEYRGLSHKLSDGVLEDILSLGSDLFVRDWFCSNQTA